MFLDILILAMIAAFVLFRLWSTLGRRTGHEGGPDPRVEPRPEGPVGRAPDALPDPGRVPQRPPADPAFSEGPIAETLARLRAADPSFEPEGFLQGAVGAHEMIVEAFARNDRGALRPLTAPDVFAAFDGVIQGREARALHGEIVFVKQGPPRLVSAVMRGSVADLTVRFESEIVTSVKDKDGRVVEGSDTAVRRVIDIWTFSRDTRSSDPNWLLIDTDTGD